MYNNNLKLIPSKNLPGEKTVVTTVNIPKNVPIIEITGDLFTSKTIRAKDYHYILQVGTNLFIGPSGNVDDYLNHSCNPNCFLHIVGKRAVLYSKVPITANSELTFDYSLSSTDTISEWHMNCKCGEHNCRKLISGYQYLDSKLKDELEHDGMVPMFQLLKIFR